MKCGIVCMRHGSGGGGGGFLSSKLDHSTML